jgi:hypothetical protein
MTQAVAEAAAEADAVDELMADNPAPSTDDTTEDDDDTDDADPDGSDELGDKGKQALARMKEKLREERRKRIAAEAARDATDPDETARATREAERAALAKANGRIVRAEIKAAAKGVLHDPADAFTFIDPTEFEVDDNGEVDADEIASAIADLVTRKPYLAAQGGPKGPRPDRSQGASTTGTATTAQQFAALADNYL